MENTKASRKITTPQAIMIQKTNEDGAKRLFINIESFGEIVTQTPLLVDTGSSGISINMKYLLPPEMYDENGVIMKDDTLTYKGVIFTNEKEVIHYGGAGVRTSQYGHIAYAQITVGDEKGNVTTSLMPFFCYYKIEKNGQKVSTGFNPGVFGINPKAVQFKGKMKPIFNFLNYGQGINVGFLLKEVGKDWSSCDYQNKECPQDALLYIGLSETMKTGYTEVPLQKINDYSYRAGVKAIINDQEKNYPINIMFDTGNSTFGEIVPIVNVNNLLTIAVGDSFQWDFHVPEDSKSHFCGNQNIIERSIIGIDFFENHSLFYDFTKGTLGLK